MISEVEVGVVQGVIAINSVGVVRKDRGLLVVEADCHSKYPEIAGYAGPTIYVGASEHTLKKRDTITHSAIVLPDYTKGWEVMAEASRYTIRIVAWKPGWFTPVWESEEHWVTDYYDDGTAWTHDEKEEPCTGSSTPSA